MLLGLHAVPDFLEGQKVVEMRHEVRMGGTDPEDGQQLKGSLVLVVEVLVVAL